MKESLDPEFLERAKAHWTPEREAKITGGKAWPLRPSKAAPLLRVLGLLSRDASMPADALRKFSQINHMITLLMPQLSDLMARHAPVRLLDACCGTSFLSLALAWLFREEWQKPLQMIGVDADPAVIATSAQRAKVLGLDDLVRFKVARVEDLNWDEALGELFPGPSAATNKRPHMMVALHACDTATDHALALGVRLKADALAVAPCCHAELARKWKELGSLDHPFGPVFRTPNLRRDIAANMTDTLRLLLLRGRGYEVTATEFVPSSHTPKNRLLLAVRRGNFLKEADEQHQDLKASLGDQGIKLEELLLGV